MLALCQRARTSVPTYEARSNTVILRLWASSTSCSSRHGRRQSLRVGSSETMNACSFDPPRYLDNDVLNEALVFFAGGTDILLF